MSLITITNLSKVYGRNDAETVALQNVDVEIHKGEFVAIMGPSGSGKSTLMNIIGLLDKPSAGSYILNGVDVSSLSDKRQAEIRSSQIGFIFQNFNLLQRHTALENVALPMLYAGVHKNTTRLMRAAKLLEKVGLEDRLHHMPNELSGGQMQRVAIARSLANKPSIILADEPSGNLDSASGQQIMELLASLNSAGNTIIMVTHDTATAAYAERIIQLKDGQVVEAPQDKVDKKPASTNTTTETASKATKSTKSNKKSENSKKTRSKKS